MPNTPKPGSMDEYIASFPSATRKLLEQLRAVIRAAAPGATEKISYAIPTFDLNGNLVHFAAFRNHLGFYPSSSGIRAFSAELERYERGKGSIQFPLGEALPVDLIRRIVEFRVAENLSRPARKSATSRRTTP